MSFQNDRVIAETLKRELPDGAQKKTALEIGCAPGKWMIFLAEETGYRPEGCEYLESAVDITRRNLSLNRLEGSAVYTGDFCTLDFGFRRFDLVISLGFIEHFTNPDPIIDKMVSLLKDDGILVIGIPNFNGINRVIAQMTDRTAEQKILPAHNLAIMNLNYFRSLAGKFPLQELFISHVGGFEPDLFDIARTPRWFKVLFYALHAGLSSRLFRYLNLSVYSGYIVAIYQRRV